MTLKRLFVFLLLLAVSLALPLNAMTLNEAENALNNDNKSELFRAYDTFKSAYLKADMSGDIGLEKRALEGIVKSGQKLHIDISSYRKKLKKLPKDDTPSQTVRAVPVPVKQSKVHALPSENRLKDVRWDNGKLVLRFKRPLKKKDVNYFNLRKTSKKGYRYVFDILGIQEKSWTLKHRDLRRVTLAQYKPTMLRLVLESNRKLPVRLFIAKDTLTISAGLAGVTSPRNRPSAIPPSSPVVAPRVRANEHVIVLDPGHGGKDTGAIGYRRWREKDVVLAIANKAAKLLRARGYTVYMTRSTDCFIKLRERTHFANRKKADLFISIHANAVSRHKKEAHGLETYFLSPSRSKRANRVAATENKAEVEDMNYYAKSIFLNTLNSEKIVASHKLAIDLQASILASLRAKYRGVKDSGVREGPFWVLVGAQMPAVLIETGFISNPNEAIRLKNRTYQDYFARGIADGVDGYFARNP
jgi:N-acetylmuramoyl-L-alanine amidase